MSPPALPRSASFPAESISPSLPLKCVCGSVSMTAVSVLCRSSRPAPALNSSPICLFVPSNAPSPGPPPTWPQAGTQQGPAQPSPHAWTGSLCVCGTPLSSFGGRAAFGPCCLLSCSAPALGVWAQRALPSHRPSGRGEVTRGSEQGNEWAALARVPLSPPPPCGLALGCRRKNSRGAWRAAAGPGRGSRPVQLYWGATGRGEMRKEKGQKSFPDPPSRALRALPRLEKMVPLFFFFPGPTR